MDPRLFVLICLAAALRPQPSPVPEVDPNDPQETKFQRLRDAVNSGGWKEKMDIARAQMWPSFLKAHPKEGWRLFEKLATDEVAHVRGVAARSPAWPMLLKTHNAEAWQLFQKLANEHWKVRWGAAESPAWPMLLKTHNAEAWQLFQKLANEHWKVRWGAAESPAWPMLLKTHNAEAWLLFEKLAADEKEIVRYGAAKNPVWPDLIQSSLSRSWQLFAELISHQDHEILRDFADFPSWKAFGKVPPTAVAERDSQELLDIARSLQKVADLRLAHEVKGLPLFDGFSTPLRRSTNETWLGEMIKLPLFVGNAAPRVSPAENV